jgi:hypothetical protein
MPVQPITGQIGIVYGTYSFVNIAASINGPNGAFPLAAGSGAAEEGITVEPTGDKATMVVGADGSVMYSLHADQSGRVLIRLQKISPTNALLGAMYVADTSTSALYGLNTIIINDMARGDNISLRGCGFSRAPTINYGREGGIMEWAMFAAVIDRLLGSGAVNVTPP